jgi:hypothetical protein
MLCSAALKNERGGTGLRLLCIILTAIITEDSCSVASVNGLIINVFASSRGAIRFDAILCGN